MLANYRFKFSYKSSKTQRKSFQKSSSRPPRRNKNWVLEQQLQKKLNGKHKSVRGKNKGWLFMHQRETRLLALYLKGKSCIYSSKSVEKGHCDCCYPSHTIWGKRPRAQRKLHRSIKNSIDDGMKFYSNAKKYD